MVEEKEGLIAETGGARMRQRRKILIFAAAVILLFGTYMGLRTWNENEEEKAAKKKEAETVYLTEDAGLTEFSYSDGEQEMSFVKEEGNWYYSEDKEIPMSQDSVQAVADMIAGLTAVRELENPDELSGYGLAEPSYMIHYENEDGKGAEIQIGNETGDYYYATVTPEETVYTISSALVSSLQFDLSGVVENDTVPSISSGNLKRVTVTENGKDTVYTDETELGELAGGLGTLTFETCADYHADNSALKDYGLDAESRMTVTAVYTEEDEENTFTVYIGKTDGENRYVMKKDSKMVYEVSASIIRNMTTVEETVDEE